MRSTTPLNPMRVVSKAALRYFDDIPMREFRMAILFCVVIAGINTLVIAYGAGYVSGQDIACGCHGPIARNYFYDFIRLKIEVSLLVIAITLSFRRVVGLCVSLLATVLIEVQYALWYLDTRRWP